MQLNISKMTEENILIDKKSDPLSCCVVWTPIPVLSWLLPFFGHIGVADSQGIIHEFVGPYYINKGRLSFGDPRRKWQIDVDPNVWDQAIEDTSHFFEHVRYDLLCSNCHYFAAAVLQKIDYPQTIPIFRQWTSGATVKIAWGMLFHGKSLSVRDTIIIWMPFMIILIILLFISSLF